jgi:hypothetical protein
MRYGGHNCTEEVNNSMQTTTDNRTLAHGLARRAIFAEQGVDLDVVMLVWKAQGAPYAELTQRVRDRFGIEVTVATIRNWVIEAKTAKIV